VPCAAQPGQLRVTIWYSVTHGGGRRPEIGDLPARHTGDRRLGQIRPAIATTPRIAAEGSFGLSTSSIVAPSAPGCLPGFRPEASRAERLAGSR
jgi:hypothetical protein